MHRRRAPLLRAQCPQLTAMDDTSLARIARTPVDFVPVAYHVAYSCSQLCPRHRAGQGSRAERSQLGDGAFPRRPLHPAALPSFRTARRQRAGARYGPRRLLQSFSSSALQLIGSRPNA